MFIWLPTPARQTISKIQSRNVTRGMTERKMVLGILVQT